jgi:hypothetical protein
MNLVYPLVTHVYTYLKYVISINSVGF